MDADIDGVLLWCGDERQFRVGSAVSVVLVKKYSSVPFDSQAGRSGVDGFTGTYHREKIAPNCFYCM